MAKRGGVKSKCLIHLVYFLHMKERIAFASRWQIQLSHFITSIVLICQLLIMVVEMDHTSTHF